MALKTDTRSQQGTAPRGERAGSWKRREREREREGERWAEENEKGTRNLERQTEASRELTHHEPESHKQPARHTGNMHNGRPDHLLENQRLSKGTPKHSHQLRSNRNCRTQEEPPPTEYGV